MAKQTIVIENIDQSALVSSEKPSISVPDNQQNIAIDTDTCDIVIQENITPVELSQETQIVIVEQNNNTTIDVGVAFVEGEAVLWGTLQGTLSDQTDLQDALNLKYNASNPSGYISGISWGQISGTLSNQTDLQTALNLKYDASNPAGYISGVAWGDITGTLSDQTDLQNALNLKLNLAGGTMSGDINMGSNNITNIATIQFDTAYTPTGSETKGTTYWDEGSKTITTILEGGVAGQHFEELYISGQNDTGVTITDGTPVMYASSIGGSGNIRITKAISSSSLPSFLQLGIATQDIDNGEQGKITTYGKVRSIQTDGANYGESWSDADIIYVSGTTAGFLTNVVPNAPIPAIPIAVVISAHASNGTLLVRPTFPVKVTELSDINGTALTTNGQIMVWDNDNNYFDFNFNINNYLTTASATATYVPFNGATKDLVLGANNFSVNDDTLVVNSFTNRVGIGQGDPDYILDVGERTDTVRLGRVLTGAWEVDTAYALFGNTTLDQTVATNYAVNQSGTGTTSLNSASGQTLYLRVGNAPIATISSALFALNQDLDMQTNDIYSNLTEGSVPFIGASGIISEDNNNLNWDSVNDRLGIGVASPNYILDVGGNADTIRLSRLLVGAWEFNSQYSIFGDSNFDQSVDGNYGVLMGSSGSLLLNAVGAQSLTLRNSGDIKVEVTSTQTKHHQDVALQDTDILLSSDVGSYIDKDNFKVETFEVTVPTAAGSVVEFASITNGNFSANVELWMTINNSNFAISKRYFAPVWYNGTVNVWHKMLPISTTGVFALNDVEIDVRISNQVASYRIRRVSGTTNPGVANIQLKIGGNVYDTKITALSSAYAAGSVTTNFAATSLTQYFGNTGVNNDNPQAKMDIMSTTKQLRLSYNTSVYSQFTVDSGGTTSFYSPNHDDILSIPGFNVKDGQHTYLILGDNKTSFSGTNDANYAPVIESRATSYQVNGGSIVIYSMGNFGIHKDGSWNMSGGGPKVEADFVVNLSRGGSSGSLPTVTEALRVYGDGMMRLAGRQVRSKSIYTGTDTTDDVSVHICDSATAFTLTVTDGTRDGEEIKIMNRGAGTVTLSGKLSTITALSTLYSGETIVLNWDVTDDIWE